MSSPDTNLMVRYCKEVLPGMLTNACDVEANLAERIGDDVLNRAEAFATLSSRDQDVIIAPFVEEVFDHRPLDSPLDLRAKVTVVVRNSLLEEAHHNGPLESGIITVTEYAAGPLSHFLAARRREPSDFQGPNPFAALATRYPRAWACLNALVEVFGTGGRQTVRLPAAPVPELPTADEMVPTTKSADEGKIVFSAIDPRFDEHLVDLLKRAAAGELFIYTSALSRYSRNSDKLHRVLEYVLSHGCPLLTTNYFIRPNDVWVRRGNLVKPNSENPLAGISDTRGLVGSHRKAVEELIRKRCD